MAEHAWTVLCQNFLIDPLSNLATLVGLSDQLIIDLGPGVDVEGKIAEERRAGKKGVTVPTRMMVVTQWFRSDRSRPETSRWRLALIDPAGEKILEKEVSVELEDTGSQMMYLTLDRLNVTGLGRYWLVVEKPRETTGKQSRWSKVARLPLQVIAA